MLSERILTIDLTIRLPDINKADMIPKVLEDFGRCAVLNSGLFWFGPVNSSHPINTLDGFYWGLNRNVLYISPRGWAYRWEESITHNQNFLRYVTGKIGIDRRFNKYYLIRKDED